MAITKAQLREALDRNAGDEDGPVQLYIKEAGVEAYYEVSAVSMVACTDPVATVLEAGDLICVGSAAYDLEGEEVTKS